MEDTSLKDTSLEDTSLEDTSLHGGYQLRGYQLGGYQLGGYLSCWQLHASGMSLAQDQLMWFSAGFLLHLLSHVLLSSGVCVFTVSSDH